MIDTDVIDTTTDNTDTGESTDEAVETGSTDDVIGGSDTPDDTTSTEEGAEPTEGDAETDGAPESYEDFTVKEGFAMNEVAKTAVTSLAKKLGLKQEGAQDIVNAFTEHTELTTKAIADAQDASIAKGKADDVATLTKEWGKDFDANKQIIAKTFDTFFEGSEAGKLVTDYFATNPVLANAMLKIGKAISEDTREVGDVVADNADKPVESYSDLLEQPNLDAKGRK